MVEITGIKKGAGGFQRAIVRPFVAPGLNVTKNMP